MTPERLKQLRFLARFATYVVPTGWTAGETLTKEHAGDDMLEMCAALDALRAERDSAWATIATGQRLIERLSDVLAKIPEDVICAHAGLEPPE